MSETKIELLDAAIQSADQLPVELGYTARCICPRVGFSSLDWQQKPSLADLIRDRPELITRIGSGIVELFTRLVFLDKRFNAVFLDNEHVCAQYLFRYLGIHSVELGDQWGELLRKAAEPHRNVAKVVAGKSLVPL